MESGRLAQAIPQMMPTVLAGLEPVASVSEAALSTDVLYRQCSPYVWRILCAMGVRPADAPDLTQEVFIVAHRRLGELRDAARARSWLYGICIRCAANYRRRAHRKNEVLCAVLPDVGTSADPALARIDLMRALDRLDDARRAVFVLYEIEELSMPEIADALGCPVTTAYCRLYSARKLVRAAMSSGKGPDVAR
jgi:RNA polymerase sigma-70 factor (ECF subfamily)